jgi:predicted chitinase/chitodextrinase
MDINLWVQRGLAMRRRLLTMISVVALCATTTLGAVLPATSASAAPACNPAYVNGQIYTGGMSASYNGRNWTAKWWTQWEAPSTGGTGVWGDAGACVGGTGNPPACNYPNWVAGTWYDVGAIVRFTNGQYYRAKNANPGYDPVISYWYWEPFTCGGGGPTDPGPGEPSGFVVSGAQFNQMFPNRNPFYTYAGLVDALAKFSTFAGTGSATVRRQEAAAFLANANHETGGLVYVTEINKSNDLCDESRPYGCPAGTYAYYGRGPIQLSWNFNYKTAGDALGLNLLANPYLVEQQASVAWQTALWYWMTQTGPGSMTPHNAMVNGSGFGETIRSINGSLECNGGNPAQVQSRINAYQSFTSILGVSPGGNLSC